MRSTWIIFTIGGLLIAFALFLSLAAFLPAWAALALTAVLYGVPALLWCVRFVERRYVRPLAQLQADVAKVTHHPAALLTGDPAPPSPEQAMLGHVARRLTRLKDAEEELRVQNGVLAETIEDLNSLAHRAAHDVRTPLTAVSSLVNSLREELGGSSGAAVNLHLMRIQERLNRMQDMVEQMCEEASVNASHDFTPLSIESVVREALNELDPEQKVDLSVKTAERSLHGPPSVLYQVMRNLLDNAIRHGDAGQCRLEVTSFGVGSFVVISLRDNGPGFDPAKQTRYLRQTHPRQAVAESGGLGLPFVRALLNRYGGNLVLGNKPGGEGGQALVYWPDKQRARARKPGRLAGITSSGLK